MLADHAPPLAQHQHGNVGRPRHLDRTLDFGRVIDGDAGRRCVGTSLEDRWEQPGRHADAGRIVDSHAGADLRLDAGKHSHCFVVLLVEHPWPHGISGRVRQRPDDRNRLHARSVER